MVDYEKSVFVFVMNLQLQKVLSLSFIHSPKVQVYLLLQVKE